MLLGEGFGALPLKAMSWKACTLPWLIASCCWKVFVAPGSLLMTAAVSDRCHLANSSLAIVTSTEKMHSWTPVFISLPSLMFSYSSEITIAANFFQFLFSFKEKLNFSFISWSFSTIITWQKLVLEKSKELIFFSGWPQVTPCSHCFWNYWSLLSLKNYSYRKSYALLIYF